MTMQEMSLDEMEGVWGGAGTVGSALAGCFNGAQGGYGTASAGYRWYGAGAGCIVGASLGYAGASSRTQQIAGMAVGLGFGPYGGSSSNPSAANYENSFDRMDAERRMSAT